MTPPLKKHIRHLVKKTKHILAQGEGTQSSSQRISSVIIEPSPKKRGNKLQYRIALLAIPLLIMAAIAGALFLSGQIDFFKSMMEGEVASTPQNSVTNWKTDQYVGIRIPDEISGTLTAEENYDIDLEIKNQTSMQMYISKVVVEKYRLYIL